LTELPEHAVRNRELWTRSNADHTDAQAPEAWAQEEITWGMFRVSESEVEVLGDVSGLDVLDLGCGVAYFSAWLARRGARPVGLDVTPAQLETARRMQAETGLSFPLVEASAEDVPLPDASFDLVLSEYGASIWCEPAAWVLEAARLLRPGGRLVGSVPNAFRLKNRLRFLAGRQPDSDPTHLRMFGPDDVRRLLAAYGDVELRFVAGRLVPLGPRLFANDIVFRARSGTAPR